MFFEIDITFDFRSDTPLAKNRQTCMDPDTYSDNLRRHHRLLWSKPLPNGELFKLEHYGPSPPYYLRWSENPNDVLSSDAVVPSFWKETAISDVIQALPAGELETFRTLGYTIGGMMVWPANRIDNKMTINAARGCHPRIKDRFDLTVECIRRYYDDPSNLGNLHNPLGNTLHRYAYFFELFRDFRGFVEFFLLEDMVTQDFSAVKFHAPFEKFEIYPFPKSIEAYRAYTRKASNFIAARNERILASI